MDEGIRCQACGADNPSDSVFCQRCGGRIGRAGARVNVTVTNRGAYVSPSGFQPAAGNKYVQFYVTVTNINDPGQTIGNPCDWTLIDSNNQQHNPASVPLDIPPECEGLQMLTHSRPGQEVDGIIYFEIPQSASPVGLIYSDPAHNNLTITL
jgi:hypothetical protein